MSDAIVRALLPDTNLKVSVVVLGGVAREARRRHAMHSASAALFAQGLLGASLMASLQKGETRINLQLECDGALRGFFVDAGANGEVRGYVKNPLVDVVLSEGAFQWRAALGNSGFLSVLRDLGGEYYRSSVELVAMRLADDLNHYFKTSDQVATRVSLTVQPSGDEPLGKVAGVLLQALPDGDLGALTVLGDEMHTRLHQVVAGFAEPEAAEVLGALFPGVEVLVETPVRFTCSCSHARAMDTLEGLGVDEVQAIVDTQGSTAITCQFCGARHEITLPNLWSLLERLGRPQTRN